MPDFRRGRDAMKKSASKKGGGGRSFVPEIYWADGDKKHILLLTPIEECPTVDMHTVLPVTRERQNGEEFTIWESVIARTDESIGEAEDPIQDQYDREPKERTLGIAIELEPQYKVEGKRKRPKGFAVKTGTYTRSTEDGEEEVTAPIMGMIVEHAGYIWPELQSYDEEQAAIIEIPCEVKREGKQLETDYIVTPFLEQPVDFTPLIDNLEGISYLSEDMEAVFAECEAADNEIEVAQAIARFMFEKRLDELADEERYDDILENIDVSQLKTWGGSEKKSKPKPKSKSKSRPARRSSRTKKTEKPEEEPEAEEPEPEAEVEPDEEPEEETADSNGGTTSPQYDALRNRISKGGRKKAGARK